MKNLNSLSIFKGRIHNLPLMGETIEKESMNHLGDIAFEQLIK